MSEKITVKQIGELVAQSETGRITRDLLQMFLENPLVVLAMTIFQRMLAICNFDWVNENINSQNFPIAGEPAEDTEYKLVCLEREASTDEVEAEIKRRGLVSADLADLLLYVRKNPNKQREFPIVALGPRWQLSDGRWCSPYVRGWRGERHLDLRCREDDWHGLYRFLARKPR